MSNDIIKLTEPSVALRSVHAYARTNIVHCVLSSLRNRFELPWGRFNCACYSHKWSEGGRGTTTTTCCALNHTGALLRCGHPLPVGVRASCRKYIFSGHYLVFICPKSALHDWRTARVHTVAYTRRINTRHTHNERACTNGTISIMYGRAVLANLFVRAIHDLHFGCFTVTESTGTRGQQCTQTQASLTHINVQFNYSAIYLYLLGTRLVSFAEFRQRFCCVCASHRGSSLQSCVYSYHKSKPIVLFIAFFARTRARPHRMSNACTSAARAPARKGRHMGLPV